MQEIDLKNARDFEWSPSVVVELSLDLTEMNASCYRPEEICSRRGKQCQTN